jgi:hypothetical protein
MLYSKFAKLVNAPVLIKLMYLQRLGNTTVVGLKVPIVNDVRLGAERYISCMGWL